MSDFAEARRRAEAFLDGALTDIPALAADVIALDEERKRLTADRMDMLTFMRQQGYEGQYSIWSASRHQPEL